MISDALKAQLILAVDNAFISAETKHDIDIPAADKEFLRTILPTIVDKYITKFVNGAVEHHDSPFLSMSQDDMIKAAIDESTDLPNYLYGYFYVKASRPATGK